MWEKWADRIQYVKILLILVHTHTGLLDASYGVT